MKHIIIISLLLLTFGTFGQIQIDGTPASFLDNSVPLEIPELSYQFSEQEIVAENDSAYDVGIAQTVNLDIFRYTQKVTLANGTDVYRLKIKVSNVNGVGLNFDQFNLPEGGKLFAYNEDKSEVLGAYTNQNNADDNKFSIQPMKGEALILEYNAPSGIQNTATISINRIAKIYRPIFGENNTSQPKSSSCTIDVHCETLEVERSVMRWYYYDENDESYYVCSCALVNQDVAANNVKPYVLTANHCGKNADLSTAIFYFNYQNTDCGTNDATLSNYTMTGGTQRAKRSVFDMFLLELYSFPPPDYNVHLSGWDRDSRSDLPDDVLGVHHPGGDEKIVSLGTHKANTNPNFWRVVWDRNDSPTLPGSSGSPLFEEDHDRIIGWLSYGTAACDNLDGIERYGKLRKAWTGPSTAKRLRNWLDPDDNDNDEIDGRDPCFTNLVINNRTFFSAEQRYQPENKVTVQAGNTLETVNDVIIRFNSEHKFTAGQGLVFKSGFHSEFGSDFLAKIEPCELIAKNTIASGNTSEESETSLRATENAVIYPNPSNGKFTLSFSQLNETDELRILDLQGRQVHVDLDRSQAKKISFDLTGQPKGVYLLNFIHNGEVRVERIVLQ